MNEFINRDLIPAAKVMAWLLLCGAAGYMLASLLFKGPV